MSGRSPYNGSGSGSQSQTTNPQSCYLSGRQGSGSRGRPGTSSSSSSDTPGYVSPYAPLPTTGATNPQAAQTATAMTATRDRPSSSATAADPLSQERLPQTTKQALIDALNEHRINTVGELRRVECILATLGSPDLTQPMTAAWVYYVNSNNFLSELRGLTRNYPFSSECLDEAKRRVHQDPACNRSWNYCWLVLTKVHTDRLIATHARAQASQPEMWGGRIPLAEAVERLTVAFANEWNAALAHFLRHWETSPTQ